MAVLTLFIILLLGLLVFIIAKAIRDKLIRAITTLMKNAWRH